MLISGLLLGAQVTPVQAVNFGLFGDVTLNDSNAKDDNSNFALGGLDFYATHTISETTRGFVEFVFENTGSGIVTDLERLWISHTFDDKFTLAAGRFHTPLGRWNRTYHHGALLQDTISRPFFLQFEDGATGILPVHIVGLMATGDFVGAGGEFSYELSVANGPSIDTSGAGFGASPSNKPEIDINDAGDPNSDKSAVLRVVYSSDTLPLEIGVFVMRNVVAESADAGGVTARGKDLVSQTIYGLDAYYERGDFDVLAEFYRFENDNEVGLSGSNSANAYYLQLGYQLNETLKAVVRYEDLSFDADDTYFRLLGTREATHGVFALRYDVDDSNSLKFEVDKEDLDSGDDVTSYKLQWAFLIP